MGCFLPVESFLSASEGGVSWGAFCFVGETSSGGPDTGDAFSFSAESSLLFRGLVDMYEVSLDVDCGFAWLEGSVRLYALMSSLARFDWASLRSSSKEVSRSAFILWNCSSVDSFSC